ncbi:hypothetical protein DRQ36_00400 [bacterium]|nr:MAG: hypothetical protein DRQ36_00400 [bacterium]
MSAIIYILITVPVLFFAVLLTVFLAPARFTVSLDDSAWFLRFNYLGYWAEKTPEGKHSGFLWWKFKHKEPKKEKKAQLKARRAEKAEKKRKKKKATKTAPTAFFWFERRLVLLKSAIIVLRMLVEAFASVKITKISLYLTIGNGQPARAGTLYGWLCALESWLPESFGWSVGYDFNPNAEWRYSAEISFADNIFRAVLLPVVRALCRLPKRDLYRFYRNYKAITKTEKKAGVVPALETRPVGVET